MVITLGLREVSETKMKIASRRIPAAFCDVSQLTSVNIKRHPLAPGRQWHKQLDKSSKEALFGTGAKGNPLYIVPRSPIVIVL